jgi:hypothetical protein
MMPSDTPPPRLLDAVKLSALKLKEKQSALDARAKELDALKAQLDAERAELGSRAAKLTADEEAIKREKEGLEDARASMARDLAAINDGRDKLTIEEERLQGASKGLEERERTIKEEEERVERLERAFTSRMTESESKLQNLLDREEELTKLQADWLAAFGAREKELHAISEDMHARQNEFAQQHDSLSVLKDAFKGELNRLLAEHQALTTKEKSILEAEKYLASALQMAEGNPEDEAVPTAPPPAPAPPESAAPTRAPEPVAEPEPVAPAAVVPVQEEIPAETETQPRATKAEAMERLARAVEGWKHARDAGWKVGDIRKTVKFARDAVETGDYESAVRLATEILDQLQATASAK